MKFPQKLRLLMVRGGLTQQALGGALGGSHRMVGKWLAGSSRPAAPQMLRLAEFFQVEVDVLADDERELPAQMIPRSREEIVSEIECRIREEIEAGPDDPKRAPISAPALHAMLGVRADLDALMQRVDAIIEEIAHPDADGKLARLLREDAEQHAVNRREADQAARRKTGQG